ncbi:SWIM zinc finger [Halorientalis persicus]|uniref:SWIM zinc finger n=1 Tax=Halorientalis persicus TaxID=1367881 RepID=A0A1H8L3Q3_9EURY|nr:SWIM zinc finger family protein [Halorientalis persicus]SEN99755.1 SWIM zinc finger [Halorientalis persicus]
MHPLERLDVSSRVAKRAQYEAFEFSVVAEGVRVRNCSHADPSEHEYVVTVRDGLPTACTCPADERFDGGCKHRVAVAIRDPVLAAVNAKSVAADGGVASEPEHNSESSENNADESDCDCPELRGEFPCWQCVWSGERKLND